MKIKNPENIAIAIFIGSICLGMFLYDISTQRNGLKKAITEHPVLKKEDSLYNEVLSIYRDPHAHHSPNIIYVTLNNGKKYRIYSTENSLYYEIYYKWDGVFDAVQVGDRLIKEKNNDTLYISKKAYDDTLFFYIIKPLK